MATYHDPAGLLDKARQAHGTHPICCAVRPDTREHPWCRWCRSLTPANAGRPADPERGISAIEGQVKFLMEMEQESFA